VSDPTGSIASPLRTVRWRAGKRPPLSRIEEVARAHEVERVVVGLPLDLGGHETAWCAEIRETCDRLADRLQVPVSYVDERLTTRQAERAVRGMGLKKSQREEKDRVDAVAAALILQSWLDGRTA
jgi:putative Holliday junction resolvase